MEPILGEIKMFAGNFAPKGWFTCEGQTLAISQYSALFSLLGTTYGGDGIQTFKLPDLRGAFPTQCTNISSPHLGGTYAYGQIGGNQSYTITSVNVPPHTHSIIKGPGTNLQGSITVATTLSANASSTGSTTTPAAGNTLGKVTDLSSAGTDVGVYNNQPANINLGGINSTVNNTLTFDPTGLTLTPWGSGPSPVPTVPPYVAMQYIIAWSGVYPSRP
ncbi:MAG: tail fiber protein [Sediminibacterium sp.]|nr:tail fiber protein [Sediminibacterium sp.]